MTICRYITKLLSDLIYFVCNQESVDTGGDPLDVEMVNPNDCRERQKLLREQNIVKQVSEQVVHSSIWKKDFP